MPVQQPGTVQIRAPVPLANVDGTHFDGSPRARVREHSPWAGIAHQGRQRYPGHHAAGVFAPGHLGELTRVIPFEVVDAALESAGGKERRVRRLPSRVVIYGLLAGVLFADQGCKQVYSRLVSELSDPVKSPLASALSGAMR